MELLNFSNEDVFDKVVMLHTAKYLSFCSFVFIVYVMMPCKMMSFLN